MMDLWRKLGATVTVELTSADIPGAMAVIQSAGFQIWDLEMPDILTLRFHLRKKDYQKLRKLCEKRGDQARLLSQSGLYWSFASLKKRPILVVGLLLLLMFSLWVPRRVFFVRVEGNSCIASRQIAEAAAQCGITFGAARREVRSEKMKNALLEAMPELAWAGVNTYGCTAVITVRERTVSAQTKESCAVSSIIANMDGVIRQITVLRGTGLCTVGQAVKAGQVLISGYTDCGFSIRAAAAEGEIFAETNRKFTAVFPTNYTLRREQTGTSRKISLIIGKKRINFTNSSGILGTGCAKIYEENYVSLPGGFVLPVAIAVETWTYYHSDCAELADAQSMLSDFVSYYLSSQMCSGKILLADEILHEQDGFLRLTGSYSCYEMIGITRIEENIPEYVKND